MFNFIKNIFKKEEIPPKIIYSIKGNDPINLSNYNFLIELNGCNIYYKVNQHTKWYSYIIICNNKYEYIDDTELVIKYIENGIPLTKDLKRCLNMDF